MLSFAAFRVLRLYVVAYGYLLHLYYLWFDPDSPPSKTPGHYIVEHAMFLVEVLGVAPKSPKVLGCYQR